MKTSGQAKRLRRNATDAEQRLWQRLRGRQIEDAKFRRQHPVGPYVADFVCLEFGLVVELDGGQHAGPAATHDTKRDAYLRAEGFHVLRIWNNEIFDNLDGVLDRIAEAIREKRE